MIKYKLLYSMYYFNRTLYILEIDNQIITVYKRSGLNEADKKGEIIPFTSLKNSKPEFGEVMSGIDYGYIYKEFYFNQIFVNHKKRLQDFGEGVINFCNQLKNELPIIEHEEQNIKEIRKYVKEFDKNLDKFLKNKNLKYYDWNNFNKILIKAKNKEELNWLKNQ